MVNAVKGVGAILVFLLGLCSAAPNVVTSTNSYLTELHRDKLFNVIEPKQGFTDVASVYHFVVGSKHLSRAIPNAAVSFY